MSTFLARLRAAREAATPAPWLTGIVILDDQAEMGTNAKLIVLLVNNAEKLERLIEDAAAACGWLSPPPDGSDNPVEMLRDSLAALDEGADG